MEGMGNRKAVNHCCTPETPNSVEECVWIAVNEKLIKKQGVNRNKIIRM